MGLFIARSGQEPRNSMKPFTKILLINANKALKQGASHGTRLTAARPLATRYKA